MMRRRNVENSILFSTIVAIATIWYWFLFDDSPFSSTTVATYGLSQSIQLSGPIILGYSGIVGRKHSLNPTNELISSSPRGGAVLASVASIRVALAANLGYLVGSLVVLIVIGTSHYANGISNRIFAPFVESFTLAVAGYLVGRKFPQRLTPAVLAGLGYFLLTEPHYFSGWWVELAHVQQERFTAWQVSTTWGAWPFIVWMAAVSCFALLLPLAFARSWTAIFGSSLAALIAATCVVSLYRGHWGNSPDEFVLDASVAVECDPDGFSCLHPAYTRAEPMLREVAAAANSRWKMVGVDPMVYEQVPTVLDAPVDGEHIAIDVFSSSRTGLQISLSEGVNAWLVSNCRSPTLPTSAFGALANWVAGLNDESVFIEELRTVFGVDSQSVNEESIDLRC